ncbi:pilin [Candidatus Parcubacteria bacterium]|nr:pilin [Candidatus Parcubacteria bacterium]
MLSFLKKSLIIFTLLLLVGIYALPVFVFAQTAGTATKEPPMQCWPQDLCKQKSGVWTETATSKKECIPFDGKETRYCYAPPPTVNLQVSIGGNQVKGLLDYIPRIYTYLVSIVSLVAVVMIMVGGLQYLTSGGNPTAISSAKERILGAIVGLFLTLGSYFLLNTINPALTQLKLPPIKMVRQSALIKPNITGQECWTEGSSAKACEESAPGNKCIPVCTENLTKLMKEYAGLNASVLLLAVGAAPATLESGAVWNTIKSLVSAGYKISRGTLSFISKHPTISAGAAAGGILSYWTSEEKGERGTCITPVAKQSLGDFAMCTPGLDECKISYKCVNTSSWFSKGSSEGGIECGRFNMCSSGNWGSPCAESTDCKSPLICLDALKEVGIAHVCGDLNDRPLFAVCDNDAQCRSGYCNPTSETCGTVQESGLGYKGLACKTSKPDCATKGFDYTGVCTTLAGMSVIYGGDVNDLKDYFLNTSKCSLLSYRCSDPFAWLSCNNKMTQELFGKCLKYQGEDCDKDEECLFSCSKGKCTDFANIYECK